MNRRKSLVSEFYLFVRQNKAYWLTPIILAVILLAGVVVLAGLGGGATAPFIYSLF
jgi:hypothetical protein